MPTFANGELASSVRTKINDAITVVDALATTIADATEVTTINAQTGTAYTLALSDRGQTVTVTNAAAVTVTIPTNAAVAFPVGSVVFILSLGGAGTVSIAGDTGVTVNGVSAGSNDLSGTYQGASALKIATDTWVLTGGIL